MTPLTSYNELHKTRNGGVFMGFLVLIILIGVVISIIASSSSENKNYSGYHGGIWGRNRDEKYFVKS